MSTESKEFRKNAHQFVDWMADYMDNIETYPVKSQVHPREIYDQITDCIPSKGEDIDVIFNDFNNRLKTFFDLLMSNNIIKTYCGSIYLRGIFSFFSRHTQTFYIQ